MLMTRFSSNIPSSVKKANLKPQSFIREISYMKNLIYINKMPIRHINQPIRAFSIFLNREANAFMANNPNYVKPKVIVLGTGWASVHFFTKVNHLLYDITIISPRNYFTFTPLLPSVCSGTLTPWSCIEPIRPLTHPKKGKKFNFFEAQATNVDFNNRFVECSSGDIKFKVPYDYLVLGVGSDTNTFGVEGVIENCHLLKDIDHAILIRKTVMSNFEIAALPNTSAEERKRLLHFVVIGGGPTGVETAGEFADFIKEDMSIYFPDMMQYVSISLVEGGSKLLPTYTDSVSTYTFDVLSKTLGVKVLFNHHVKRVNKASFICITPDGKEKEIPHGFVLWASGVGQTPLINKLRSNLDKLTTPLGSATRGVPVDEKLRVKGVENVYAFGDCAQLIPRSLESDAKELFALAGSDASSKWLHHESKTLQKKYPQLHAQKYKFSDDSKPLNFEEFTMLLKSIDTSYRCPVPTAQNARQEGYYLADVFNKYPTFEEKSQAVAFCENWGGSLAYVGAGNAVGHLPFFNMTGGWWSLPFWKAVYMQMQFSWRSRMICVFDWIRTQFAGRDVGFEHQYFK